MKPKILTDRSRVEGCVFVKQHKYHNGHTVPIYEHIINKCLKSINWACKI